MLKRSFQHILLWLVDSLSSKDVHIPKPKHPSNYHFASKSLQRPHSPWFAFKTPHISKPFERDHSLCSKLAHLFSYSFGLQNCFLWKRFATIRSYDNMFHGFCSTRKCLQQRLISFRSVLTERHNLFVSSWSQDKSAFSHYPALVLNIPLWKN